MPLTFNHRQSLVSAQRQRDQFLVHRSISKIPELYTPPGEAEWLALYEQ